MLGRNLVGLDIHRAVEGAMGLVLVICPILFGFAPGSPLDISVEAVFVAGALGLPLAGLGFAARREGDAVPPSLHRSLDGILAAALVVTCIVFALRGDRSATLLFAFVGFPYALLVLATRYASEGQDSGGQDEATTVSEESVP